MVVVGVVIVALAPAVVAYLTLPPEKDDSDCECQVPANTIAGSVCCDSRGAKSLAAAQLDVLPSLSVARTRNPTVPPVGAIQVNELVVRAVLSVVQWPPLSAVV